MINLMLGDCLERMKEIPDGSVDAILCDPPYGTMAGIKNVNHGMSGKTEWDVAIDPALFLVECNRVLRMNGALVLFSQEPYTSRLITEAHGNLPFSYRLMWLKDHFANALLAKKAPVSYFEDILVFFKQYDTLGIHPLREYARLVRDQCGGQKSVYEQLGHQKTDHFFRVESTQFGLCTEATYGELCLAYHLTENHWFKTFDELAATNRTFNRTFNLPDGEKYKSNVLTYKKDYSGHHPTQKPVALMEDLIRTYTNEGDAVLDFTMGSGTTGVACANTGRKFIGIEREPKYFEIATQRINAAVNAVNVPKIEQLELIAA